MDNCIFCKIVRGEIPSRKVYEDEHVFAFHDINPLRPVHVLVIPKRHIESLAHASEADAPVLGRHAEAGAADRPAFDANFAGGDFLEAGDAAQQRRLAAARGAEQRDQLAAREIE